MFLHVKVILTTKNTQLILKTNCCFFSFASGIEHKKKKFSTTFLIEKNQI